jgi:transporter family-2 protein
MQIALIIAVVLAGAATALQTGMNAQLRDSLGHILTSMAANFSVGLLSILLMIVALQVPMPSSTAISQTPAWAWFGGIIGAFLVGSLAYASRDLGMLLTIGLLIAGQAIGSALLDHYGVMGYQARPFNLSKLLACLMLLGGVLLLKRSS